MNARFTHGFTLIELLVALAIAALLLVLAAPTYTAWLADSQVLNGAQSVAGGLQLAQAEAIKRNADVQFVLDSTTGTGGWSVQLASDGSVLDSGVFAEGAARIQFTPSPAGLTTVTFTPLGQTETINADTSAPLERVTVTATSAGGTRTLVVMASKTAGGAHSGVKICDTGFTWPDPKACPP